MPYSVFKRLGKGERYLIKINLSFNGVGGDPMEAKGVISIIELTVGCKTMTTAFFVRHRGAR